MKTYTIITFTLLSAFLLAVLACSGGSQPLTDIDTTVEARVTAERATDSKTRVIPTVSAHVPSEQVTPRIPAGFDTYTDGWKLFTISYPREWELNMSTLEEDDKIMRDFVVSTHSDATVATVEQIRTVFDAGGTELGVNVIVDKAGIGMKVTEYAEAAIKALKSVYDVDSTEFFKLNRQINLHLGSEDAVILDYEFDLSGVNPELGGISTFHAVVASAIDGAGAWVINCAGAPAPMSKNDIRICEDVISTFRILR